MLGVTAAGKDFHTFAGQQNGDRATDAGRSTGHDCVATLQLRLCWVSIAFVNHQWHPCNGRSHVNARITEQVPLFELLFRSPVWSLPKMGWPVMAIAMAAYPR